MELTELHRITEAKVLREYRLGLQFDDGTYKEVDIHPWLEQRPLGVFEPLLDLTYFAQVRVDPALARSPRPRVAVPVPRRPPVR